MEFSNNICIIYKRPIKNIILKKYVVPFQNGGQITDFYFASFQFWPEFEKKKTTSPKECFNEIWLKVGEHE